MLNYDQMILPTILHQPSGVKRGKLFKVKRLKKQPNATCGPCMDPD